jgi:WD40 repeat protein
MCLSEANNMYILFVMRNLRLALLALLLLSGLCLISVAEVNADDLVLDGEVGDSLQGNETADTSNVPILLKGTSLWSYATGKRITSTAITADGSYSVVGTHRTGEVFLLDQKGAVIWNQIVNVPVYAASIATDGTLITVAADKLYVIYPHGGEAWQKDIGFFPYSTAVSAGGSHIVAGFDDGSIRCFDRKGAALWSYQLKENVYAVSITSNGSFTAVGSDDDRVYLLDTKGKEKWSYRTGGNVRSVSISSDGLFIAAGSNDRVAYLFNQKGVLVWKYKASSPISSVSISSDAQYIAAAEGSRVHIFNLQGKILWEYDTGSQGNIVSASSLGNFAGPDVTSVALSSSATYLLVGTGAGDQKVYYYTFREVPIEVPEQAVPRAYLAADSQSVYLHAQAEGGGKTADFAFISGIVKPDPTAPQRVVRISVSPEWVVQNGDKERVRIMEWSGTRSEILKTSFIGYDLSGNLIFEAVSEREKATYGLTVQDAEHGYAQLFGVLPLEIAVMCVLGLGALVFCIYTVRFLSGSRRRKYR